MTDSGARRSVVVVDLAKGTAHSRLDDHPSTQPDETVEVAVEGKSPTIAADGIGRRRSEAALARFDGRSIGRSIYVTASRIQNSAWFNKDAPAAVPTKLLK